MTKICKFTVEIEMALEGDSTPDQAEASITDWMDRMMLYQIGYNEVADTKRPYVFDYDIKRINESCTPALDRAKSAHCRSTLMIGKQCLNCGYSKIIENRPAYVVCNKLHMEMPGNYTCNEFDRYGRESE